ncbi:hypothetical protein ERJ75_000169900 [Trypanosoma vivax]|uniref:Uncharacterized protein n=1 Tax=Trypanosoma vivax (strain Y486) TaxID=1055687 RepID=F9WMY8_TRYVY|nr:hypothetical protein ERJ75_000169900 [Trypanosoma vivax]CCD18901.1 hypothetical protein, conserved in T.vivax [Trypanosoma vivax Y486]|eukprot:CCD18901.1 hypothetical protein, conserved in T.vivax [Trypanosoma vivax Y486]
MKTVKENVNNEEQNAGNAVDNSNRVHKDAKAAYKLVNDVTERLHSDHLTPIPILAGTYNSITTRSVAEASKAACKSVRAASEANTAANTLKRDFEAQSELLKFVQTQLANMNVVTGNKISNETFEACNDSVSRILKSKSSDAIRHIAEFNMSLLSKLNNTLQKIGSTTNAIEDDLSGVSKQVQGANGNTRNAFLLSNRATENVKQTIVKVLSGVATKLCAALSELRALHDKAEAFSARAANARANISEWVVRVDAAAKESDALVDLPTSVEGAFATAEKRLAVLRRVLHRADEQRVKVAGELADSAVVAKDSRNGPTQVNKTLRDVLANITSRVPATFSKDVCNASLMSESLKLLSNMTDHPAVMSSLHVVAQLNKFADSMEGQVLKVHGLMRVAAASSAQVDAALEEAIGMARERSGKPQCPALYQQLLGALGLHL